MTRKEALRILRLPENATAKQIRKQYYILVRASHPDKTANSKNCSDVTNAYARLTNVQDSLPNDFVAIFLSFISNRSIYCCIISKES